MTPAATPRLIHVSTVLAATLALSACSGSGEDVRVTLCKDMVAVKLAGAGPVNWTEATTETRGKEYAAVKLSWSGPGGQGTASCYYNYDAVDDTALALADPLSPFSTSPSKMLLNGSTLSRQDLAETVKQAMLKQGRSLIDAAKNAWK